jgi:hypothetical protein
MSLRQQHGAPRLLAWPRHDDAGRSVGEIGDPMVDEVRPDGALALARVTSDARRA